MATLPGRIGAHALPDATGRFGALEPLLAPRSVAVVGASEREGNLGGLAVGFLRKFGYRGAVWPVNPGVRHVRELACYPTLDALPGVPDLAILAVPAERVNGVARECVALGIPAAIVWAGGFAETGDEGAARQRELEALCRESGLKLCGPNCIGVINTGLGLTASFSSMLAGHARLTPGAVSMVSQSGGIGVMAHARAQGFGLGLRVTVSCGNEAALTIPDFMHALLQDDGTRVLAVYTEGLSDADGFVAALAEARERDKPVVVMKGGASEASGRAALAHTGRLAGSDRMIDAVFREYGVLRVHSTEELLDVALQLASMRRDQLPRGERVLVSSFGGGSGVVATDQCTREDLAVPVLDPATRETLAPLLTPLSSAANPVDFTPGMVTDARHRERLPRALEVLAGSPDTDAWLFLAAGFGRHAPELVAMLDTVRTASSRPICLSWQSMPAGTAEALAARGIYTFTESARAARTLGHLARHAAQRREGARRLSSPPPAFDWGAHVDLEATPQVIPEHRVAAILGAAGLEVAPGQVARTPDDAVEAARTVAYPVAMKGLSPAVTHRAAAGLLALGVADDAAARAAAQWLNARAATLGVSLDGVWVQHMVEGDRELLVTAVRDAQFGVMVGCGIGGGMTEIVDDVAFARAPIDAAGAFHLLGELRTLRAHPEWLTDVQRRRAADFIARFSALAASAPWPSFTLEVNPLKVGKDAVAAVDGLLIVG